MLKTSDPSAVRISSARRGERTARGRGVSRSDHEVQFDLAGRGENRRFDRRRGLQPPRVDRLCPLLDVRLPSSHGEERRSEQPLRTGPRRERPGDKSIHHRQQFARRSGQEDDQAVTDVDHLAGCGPIRILEDGAALNHQPLPPVHVGHLQAPARKPLHQALDDVGMLDEGKAEHVRQRIAGHIVVGRPEAAGQDDEVGAFERAPQVLGDLTTVVADHGLRPQLDAERAQPLREHERVRIEPRRSQQLAPDRDDLGCL